MRSLDPVNTTTAHQPAPRAAMAPRARNGKAATGFRFSSSIEAATAAAAAAAANTAAKRSAAAATAHAAETANGATEQVKPATEGPRERPVNYSVKSNVPAAAETAVVAVAVNNVADNARKSAVRSVPAREKEAAVDSAVADGECAKGSFDRVCESDTLDDATRKADQDAEQAVLNPFVSSQKLARTPPAAVASSAVVAITGAAVAHVSKGAEAFCSSNPLEATRAAAPGAGDDRARQESPEPRVAADPFASKSRVPRTPVEKATVSQLSHGAAMAGAGGETGVEVGEVGGMAARVQIGELRQEVASMADRLAKQADERSR